MTDTIEEVRIAKGDVLSAGGNLLADIREHDFAIDDAKDAVVYRNDRAMAAKMLAAAARFGVTREAMLSAGQNQMRIGTEWRQTVAIGSLKLQASE